MSDTRVRSGRDLVERDGPLHPPEAAHPIDHARHRRLIEVNDHEGVAATLLPRQPKVRDVHAGFGEDRRDRGDRAANVVGDEDQSAKVAGDFDRETVDLRDQNATRAE